MTVYEAGNWQEMLDYQVPGTHKLVYVCAAHART
jgi:hypothetical protein